MKTDWGYSERFPFNPNCLHWCNSVQLPNKATGQHSSPESLKGCWVSLTLYIKAAECTRLCAASFQQKEVSCLRRSNDVTVSRFRQKHVCRMYAIYRLRSSFVSSVATHPAKRDQCNCGQTLCCCLNPPQNTIKPRWCWNLDVYRLNFKCVCVCVERKLNKMDSHSLREKCVCQIWEWEDRENMRTRVCEWERSQPRCYFLGQAIRLRGSREG